MYPLCALVNSYRFPNEDFGCCLFRLVCCAGSEFAYNFDEIKLRKDLVKVRLKVPNDRIHFAQPARMDAANLTRSLIESSVLPRATRTSYLCVSVSAAARRA